MATLDILKKFFQRKRNTQLACVMHLSDPNHVHTDACFIEIAPLSVLELYQSQSCKSCPPAIPIIHKAADGPNNLLLTYDVTYWDHLGWADTFGRSQWDARQRAYVTRWGRQGIYTPHVIVDGIADGVGKKEGEINELMEKARGMRGGMSWAVTLTREGDIVRVFSERSEAEQNDVLVISYDPKPQTVKVGKGPNKGKKIVHRNVVRDIAKLGEWRGGEEVIRLPGMEADGLERVMIVQQGVGGPILAALKL